MTSPTNATRTDATGSSARPRRSRVRDRAPYIAATALALAAVSTALVPGACTFSPNIQSGKLSCSAKGECPRGFTCAATGTSAGRCVEDGTPIGPSGAGTGAVTGFAGKSGSAGATGTAGNPGTAGSSGPPDGGIITPPDGGFGMDATIDLHFEVPPPDLVVGAGSGGATGAGGRGGPPGTGGSGVPTMTTASYIGTWVFDVGSYFELDCGTGTPDDYAIDKTTLSIYASPLGTGYVEASWSFWSACTYQLYLANDGLHLYDADWQCGDTTDDPTLVWFGNTFDLSLTSTTGRGAIHDASYVLGEYYADGTTYYCDQYASGTLTKR